MDTLNDKLIQPVHPLKNEHPPGFSSQVISIHLSDLSKPFAPKDIEWRVGSSGMAGAKPWATILKYVTARGVMDRLDDVVGPGNWKDKYHHLPGGVMCMLSIKIGDEWVTKEDGSPETAVESFKGGISKALVRAGTKWGIGRYLYDTPITFANFVDKKTKGAKSAKIKGSNVNHHWVPPVEKTKTVETAKPKQTVASNNEAVKAMKDKSGKINQNQIKRMFTIARAHKVSQDTLRNIITDFTGKTSSKDLTAYEYDRVILAVESNS